MTTTWTTDDLARLEKSLATGVKKVVYETMGSVEYGTIDEMLKLRQVMRQSLGVGSTTVRRFAQIVRG
jgi:hypothetical protein